MGPGRVHAASQDSTALAAGAPAAPASHPAESTATPPSNEKKKRRKLLRNPFQRPRLGSKRNSNSSSSKRRQHRLLPQLHSDKLCLRALDGLLPQQLMDELRNQTESGAEPLAAVQQTANNKLGKLGNSDVQRLFLAAAATTSASCGALHIAKRLACMVAKPLRLSRPMGFVTGVLMPTGVYGPLLAAYVTVVAAKGAIRQIGAEGRGDRGGDKRDTDHGEQQQEEEEGRDGGWRSRGQRGAAGQTAEGANPGPWQQQHYGGGAGHRQYAEADLEQRQHHREEAETSMLQQQPAGSTVEHQSGRLAAAPTPAEADTLASSSGKARAHQQRQQQHKGGAPWWAIWKLKQHPQWHQQQQQEAPSAPPDAEQLLARADHPAAAPITQSSSSTPAPKDSSSSSSSSSGSGHRGDLDHGRLAHTDCGHAPAGAADTAAAAVDDDAAAAAAGEPLPAASAVWGAAVPACKDGTQSLQQQQQQEEGDFVMPLLQHPSSSSPVATPGTLDADPNSQNPSDQPCPHTPARADSAGNSNAPVSPLPRFLTQITPRSDHSSDLRSDRDLDQAGSISSPTELDSQVDKLQRRWSSGDHSDLIEEGSRQRQWAQPYRPPVFSRLASGRAACRITAAAAAREEAEDRPDHPTVQGSAGSSSSKIGPGRAGSGLPPSPRVLHGTVSLDLGSEIRKHGGLGGHDHRDLAGLHKAHSDGDRMQPMGPMAAGAAGSSGSSSSHSGQQQETPRAQSLKVHKSLDWGHRLMAAESCQQS